MALDTESLKQHLPIYLASPDQDLLIRELEAISKGGTARYVLSEYEDSFRSEMLQGDGWQGFALFDLNSNGLKTVRGLVLSNSCDVDPQNRRDDPARIIFSPLIKLATLARVLKERGLQDSRLKEKLHAIKSQKTTNMFYLPAGGVLEEDYVVRLDDTHSIPSKYFGNSEQKSKIFTLTNTGFYMLLLKLSVHFCRLQENVNRNSSTP